MANAVTIKDLYDWINASYLGPKTALYLDGDGTLMADLNDRSGFTYLHIGFAETGDDGPAIDGIEAKDGDLVFWVGDESPAPWWIVEWQPDNGGVFAIVNAAGVVGTAMPSELSRNFRKARGGE
jgi:hypothetical protein